jgi:diguanylate cyclase (GGDEF)-like protein
MRSLRTKILALAALLVVLTQVGTIGTVLVTANSEETSRAESELLQATETLARAIGMRSELIASTFRTLATDREFLAAVGRGELSTVSAAIAQSMQQVEADIAVVLDANGRVLAGTNALAERPTTFAALVRDAARQTSPRAVITVGSTTYQMVTLPIPGDGQRPQMWLSSGIALNDARAQRIRQISGFQLAFLSDREGAMALLGSAVADVPRDSLARLVYDVTDVQKAFALHANGRDYLAVKWPLISGSSEVTVLLLQSLDNALATYRGLRLSVIGVGVLALLVALAGAAVVSRAITQPLRQLAQAARRISEGDYGETVRVHGGGEISELAAAFNTMQTGIAERENRITYQAQFDALTGLPNRTLALENLTRAMTRSASCGSPVSVLVVDLGSLGTIVSSLGHDIGDALLSQTAERLRASVDARHTVARVEGDEFLIILQDTGLEAARELAEDLLRLLAVGLSVHEINVSLDAVIGIATYPEHSREPDQLMLRATVAKNDGRRAKQRLHVYQEGSEEGRKRQLAILGDLRRAVRHDELKLYLQPKIALASGAVCGAEALVRWDHPTFGWLTPNEFIPIAEQSGNISLITRWALTATVRECRLWLEEGLEISVSVNLSSRDLLDQDLPMFILELLRDHDLDASYLIVEVTEEALVHDFAHASLVLQCLRDIGVRISIDDFGTGYSSLAQIRRLPVDELKIDRSFVMSLPDSAHDAAIVHLAVDLAHRMGLEVVAEGVETQGALDWLAAQGCERAQGYLIARPMPAETFGTWVVNFRNGTRTGTVVPIAQAV